MAEGHIGNTIYDDLHPTNVNNFERPETKLMINILTGGKSAGSTVRYSRFYLIVDPYQNLDINIPQALNKFIAELRKKFAIGKGGEANFKIQADGSYFNAFASATDTLKNIEDAIALSGASGKPQTAQSNSKRLGTAESVAHTNSVSSEKDAAVVKTKNVFRIGINCDAEQSFNKDPKDPNKYEAEGVKGQLTNIMLVESFVKLCQEHPLLTYIEDPFVDSDIEGYKKMKEGLSEAGLNNVHIGMKQIFKDSQLSKVQDLTSFRDLTEEELAEQS